MTLGSGLLLRTAFAGGTLTAVRGEERSGGDDDGAADSVATWRRGVPGVRWLAFTAV